MSLEESFMESYQRLSPDGKERLHRIIMKNLGEKLTSTRDCINPAPLAPPRVLCPNCGTFIKK